MTNHCGTCTACCRVFAVAEMPEKKAGDWCKHCAIGKGCKIYEDRPPTCVQFECLWLVSQKRENQYERLAPELRPDKCKVVFSPTTDPTIMAGTVMPGSTIAHAQFGPARTVVEGFVKGGINVVLGKPGSTTRFMVKPDGTHVVRMTEPDETGMQWSIPNHEGAT